MLQGRPKKPCGEITRLNSFANNSRSAWHSGRMSIELTLGLIGAAGTAASIYLVAKQRPRLAVNFGSGHRLGEPPHIWVEVTNRGHVGTTARRAGFYARPLDFEV